MEGEPRPLRIYLALTLTMLFWGGTFIAGRMLAGQVHPASAAFFRFAIATAALAVLARLIDGRLILPPPRLWPWLALLGLTGVFSYNILFFTGLQSISAGRAALIIALNPLAIALAGSLLFRETLTRWQLTGIGLSLVGALVVISNGQPMALLSGGFGAGEMAILGCVASWAAYSLLGRRVLRTLSPLAAVFYSSLVGSLLLLPVAWTTHGPQPVADYGFMAWLCLAFLGILGTAAGFSMYYAAIRRIGSTRAAVFINLVPVFAIVLSWLFLGEVVRLPVLAGGVLILAGVYLTNRFRSP